MRARTALPVLLVLAAACRALGTEERSLAHGGRERTYHVHIPKGSAASKEPRPLVIALHGGSGTGEGMVKLTRGRLNELADRDGWVVVYPDGVGKSWNDGRGAPSIRAHREGVDDVGFISSLIDVLARDARVDPSRVYVTGASNGGFMSYRLACDLSTRIAAAAPVMAAMPAALASSIAAPARLVPLLAIAGTEDPLVPFEGGEVKVLGSSRGKILSVPDSARLWARWNRCAPEPAVQLLADGDPADETRVRRERFAPLAGGAEVVLYVVEGGGHTWPGGSQYLPVFAIGRTSRDVDACELLWSFFAAH